MPMPEIDFAKFIGAVPDEEPAMLPSHNPKELDINKILKDHAAQGVGNPLASGSGAFLRTAAVNNPLSILLSTGSILPEVMVDTMNKLAGRNPADELNIYRKPIGGVGALDEALPKLDPATPAEKIASKTGEFTGMMAGPALAGKLKALEGLGNTLGIIDRSMSPTKALTAGAAGGLIAGGVEEATGSATAGLAAGILGPVAARTLKVDVLANVLANNRGAVVNPFLPSTGPTLWERKVGSKVQALLDRIGDVEVIGNKGMSPRIANALGGKRPVDWVTSPLDRAPTEVSNQINRTIKESGRLSLAVEDSAKAMQDLNLDEREIMGKFLTSSFDMGVVPDAMKPKFASIFKPYEDALVHTKGRILNTPELEKMYQNDMKTRMQGLLTSDMSNPEWQAFKSTWRGDMSTPEGQRSFLDSVITSPHISPEVRGYALDLYNLPSKTLGEVSINSKKSLENVLYKMITENPEVAKLSGTSQLLDDLMLQYPRPTSVNPKAMAEWDAMIQKKAKEFEHLPGIPALKDYVIHRDVAEGLRDLNQVQGAVRRTWNSFFLNPWKLAKAIMNPPARVRDVINNMAFADVAGAHPLSPYRVDRYLEALKEIKHQGQYFKEFHHYGGIAPGNWADVNVKELLRAAKHDASIAENLLSWTYNNKLSRTMINITQNGDEWVKLAKFIHNRKAGMEGEAAAFDAIKSVGDFARQNKATRLVRDTAMPFFGWQMHALRTMGQGLIHRPVRTMKYLAMPYFMQQYALSQLGINKDDWEQIKETLPEYQQGSVMGIPTHIPVPFRDEKGRIQLFDAGWWLPGLQDISELGKAVGSPVDLMQNPAINIYASYKNNKKFSGSPIWHEWEPPDVKAGKVFAYGLEQLLPSLTPGVGTQWNKIMKSFGEDPMNENLTPEQALGSLVGYRVTPFYPELQASKYHKGQARKAQEATSALRRDAARTTDEGDINRMTENYQRVIDNIYKNKE